MLVEHSVCHEPISVLINILYIYIYIYISNFIEALLIRLNFIKNSLSLCSLDKNSTPCH